MRISSHSAIAIPRPVHSRKSTWTLMDPPAPARAQQEPRLRKPNYSIPHSFENILHHEPELSPPTPRQRNSVNRKYHLHIRQQPTAAQAYGASDRNLRRVNPPPIVQIFLLDFELEWSDNLDILQDVQFAVGCLLLPASESYSRLQTPN